ncbi:protein DOWNY MILDEW RESISTANCE 6 [Sesamum angolense]|uniref:Protein DOWNY MILDEW RESISTANCE 6 n=1 Tax=Sesamum angolense TaxID=2727404 RepID=A0AAE1WVM7_9LAMI|nr:protein DOWNY MILDEW RESISTANCE 6 [Sesamum angolense]
MAKKLELPIIDFASSDRNSTAHSIRQACIDCGFFYLVNHGVDDKLLQKVLEGSKAFFSLSLEEKMKLARKEHRGYTPLYAENLDPSSSSRGDSKESFYIGPLEDIGHLNQWPSEEVLPSWRSTMEDYYKRVLSTLHRVIPTDQERYSVAFFLDPNPDCVVECLESCCESAPPRYPPIRSGDYLKERLKLTYGS